MLRQNWSRRSRGRPHERRGSRTPHHHYVHHPSRSTRNPSRPPLPRVWERHCASSQPSSGGTGRAFQCPAAQRCPGRQTQPSSEEGPGAQPTGGAQQGPPCSSPPPQLPGGCQGELQRRQQPGEPRTGPGALQPEQECCPPAPASPPTPPAQTQGAARGAPAPELGISWGQRSKVVPESARCPARVLQPRPLPGCW